MRVRATNRIDQARVGPPSRYILFTPERGLISEHRTLAEATLAVCEEMKTLCAAEAPEIYEQIGFDWARVVARTDMRLSLAL